MLCGVEAAAESRSRPPPWTLEDAAIKSDLVAVGVVGAAEGASMYQEGPLRTVYRQWDFRVSHVVMGDLQEVSRLTLLTRGGALSHGARTLAVDEYTGPQFEGGEQILACLLEMGPGTYRFAELGPRRESYYTAWGEEPWIQFFTRGTEFAPPPGPRRPPRGVFAARRGDPHRGSNRPGVFRAALPTIVRGLVVS
jgi:hypothetical protein